jgi:hypothetical protein
VDTPTAGPNAPFARSNPSNTNYFCYDFLDPGTKMTLCLTGAPDGNFAIPLMESGSFVTGAGFSFLFTSSNRAGVAICGQNNLGLTPRASIFGPIDTDAFFPTADIPEPSTWAMMPIGFVGLGFVGCRRQKGVQA